MSADVIVIGAGLSGLSCALALRSQGLAPLVVEAAEGVGGRVATERHEGFLLDRGFQVLQTWYPEARRQLDYTALDLRPFYPGALVRCDGRFHRVSDVWRRPNRMLEMLRSPTGTFADKLRLLGLRRRALKGDLEALYGAPETTAIELLAARGFSERIIERFFKPFFAGVFFEPQLEVSSRAFEFVFRAFALGDTSLPANGMGSIPAQLAARLPPDCVRFGCRVERILGDGVALASGEKLEAPAVVIATDGAEAVQLLGGTAQPPARGTTCCYFAAEQAPIDGPYLVVNGEGRGLVNSLLCPSNLSAAYAPTGWSLISVNVFGVGYDEGDLQKTIRQELEGWLGAGVRRWNPLKTYQIPRALPAQGPPRPDPAATPYQRVGRAWVCGEYASAPSIHWALHSGRKTGEAVAASLRG
jgi:phytoene dehydrogenase-like protein